MIEGLLTYSTSACSAIAAVFYWIEDSMDINSIVPLNVPSTILSGHSYCANQDPLHILNIPAEHAQIAFLEDVDWGDGRDYVNLLEAGGIGDEVDLIFREDSRPVAGLSLFRPPTSKCFRSEDYAWENMRSYFETTLRAHSQLRLRAAERRLQHDFRLSRRERQVLQMLVCGASNADISELMGVSLATSKTHLVNIFNKLGVDNRSAAVAFALHLQLQ